MARSRSAGNVPQKSAVVPRSRSVRAQIKNGADVTNTALFSATNTSIIYGLQGQQFQFFSSAFGIQDNYGNSISTSPSGTPALNSLSLQDGFNDTLVLQGGALTLSAGAKYTGNGSTLSSLNASAIASGTIPYLALSGISGSGSGTILSNTGSALQWANSPTGAGAINFNPGQINTNSGQVGIKSGANVTNTALFNATNTSIIYGLQGQQLQFFSGGAWGLQDSYGNSISTSPSGTPALNILGFTDAFGDNITLEGGVFALSSGAIYKGTGDGLTGTNVANSGNLQSGGTNGAAGMVPVFTGVGGAWTAQSIAGASQTPWLSLINGAGNTLSNVSKIVLINVNGTNTITDGNETNIYLGNTIFWRSGGGDLGIGGRYYGSNYLIWTNTQTLGVDMTRGEGDYTASANVTLTDPINCTAAAYNTTVLNITNSSGAAISVNCPAYWHTNSTTGAFNCTNFTKVWIEAVAGKWTNAIISPLW